MPRGQLIKFRKGSAAPTATDFQESEPAWDSTGKTLYIKAADGSMVQIGSTSLSYDASTRQLSSSTGDDVTLSLVTTSAAGLAPATGFQPLTYAATTNLDMAVLDQQYRTLTLTGDVTFTTSNRANGRMVSIRIMPGASQRTLTFPVEWDFVCPKPATIAASKTAVLSLTFYGTSDDDCVAAYAVQS